MKIDFENIEVQNIIGFKGGKGVYRVKMVNDENNKIMLGTLVSNASIGLHSHDTSSEIIFVTKGTLTAYITDCNGNKHTELIHCGSCHYCKMGESHMLVNETQEDVNFYAVVGNHIK